MKKNKLKVALCFTKNKEPERATVVAFGKGVERCGDIVYPVYSPTPENFRQVGKMSNVIIQYGEWNPGNFKSSKIARGKGEYDEMAKESKHYNKLSPSASKKARILRGWVHDICNALDRPKIMMDIGFLNANRWKKRLDSYTAIGFNGFKSNGEYHNLDSPSDRWDQLGLTLAPWRKEKHGKNIIIVGQPQGVSLQRANVNKKKWLADIVGKIKSKTNRTIIYRQHPNEKDVPIFLQDDFGVKIREKNPSIVADLSSAWCVVTLNSNYCIDALLHGVPVICTDQLGMTYGTCSNSVLEINNPLMNDREQFFYNLAYAQWNYSEIESGKAWKHLRQFVT